MNEAKQQFYKTFYDSLNQLFEAVGGSLQEIELFKSDAFMKGIKAEFQGLLSAPAIYPELYYVEDYAMEDIIGGIGNQTLDAAKSILDQELYGINKEESTHLYAAVANYERNKEWLDKIPHEKVFDMALYAKWDYGNGFEMRIDERILTGLQMTKEEVFKIAKENSIKGRELHTVEELVPDYTSEHDTVEEVQNIINGMPGPMYFFDCKNGFEGGTIIANPKALKQIHQQLGDDFYILPCTVEQVAILPKSECDTELEGLEKFIEEMNEQDVPLQTQLSAHVYEFDGTALKLAGDNLTLEKDGLANTITHHRSR